jgi:hypothetical protein
MQERLKSYVLVICLFVFLFVIIGGGLHLNPGGAFLAAVTGTPLVIYVFRSRSGRAHSPINKPPDTPKNEVSYVGSTPDKSE